MRNELDFLILKQKTNMEKYTFLAPQKKIVLDMPSDEPFNTLFICYENVIYKVEGKLHGHKNTYIVKIYAKENDFL